MQTDNILSNDANSYKRNLKNVSKKNIKVNH